MDEDWTYQRTSAEFGPFQYAAHGGLIVYGDKASGKATGFHSTLTLGSLRYVFFSRLTWLERMELSFSFPEFNRWCQSKVREAIENPLTENDRLALGLDS